MTGPEPVIAVVGGYGPADVSVISAFTVSESGLQPVGAFAGIENPSFLLVHPDGNHVYAVGETGPDGTVHALRIHRKAKSIGLQALGERSTGGGHPCHLASDPRGRWLAVANYSTGNLALFPILPDAASCSSRSDPAAADGQPGLVVLHRPVGTHLRRGDARPLRWLRRDRSASPA